MAQTNELTLTYGNVEYSLQKDESNPEVFGALKIHYLDNDTWDSVQIQTEGNRTTVRVSEDHDRWRLRALVIHDDVKVYGD